MSQDNTQENSSSNPETATLSTVSFYGISESSIPTKPEDLEPIVAHIRANYQGPVNTVPLPHHVHTAQGAWLKQQPAPSPKYPVSIGVDVASYSTLGLTTPKRQNEETESCGSSGRFDFRHRCTDSCCS